MARETVLNENVQKIIVNAIAGGNYNDTACKLAGIHPTTFYGWMRKADEGISPYAELQEAVEKAEAYAEAERIKRIKVAADEGNWQAAAWYLERKHNDRWGRREKQDINANVGGSINIVFDSGMGQQ